MKRPPGCYAHGVHATDNELDVRNAITEGSDRWTKVFRSGLQAMKDPGDLRGMLLTQADRDHAALCDALYGAIAYVESHASRLTPTRAQH